MADHHQLQLQRQHQLQLQHQLHHHHAVVHPSDGDDGTASTTATTATTASASNERGRGSSREPSNGANASEDGDGEGDGDGSRDGGEDGRSPAGRKRRRSRKDLDRKFVCREHNCGKHYSRAEHLNRHDLNHHPKQIFFCGFADCTRTFVRQDLCTRHRARHENKNSSLQRREGSYMNNHLPAPGSDGNGNGNGNGVMASPHGLAPPGRVVGSSSHAHSHAMPHGSLSPESPATTVQAVSPSTASVRIPPPLAGKRRSPVKQKALSNSARKQSAAAIASPSSGLPKDVATSTQHHQYQQRQRQQQQQQQQQQYRDPHHPPAKVRRISGDSPAAQRRASTAKRAPAKSVEQKQAEQLQNGLDGLGGLGGAWDARRASVQTQSDASFQVMSPGSFSTPPSVQGSFTGANIDASVISPSASMNALSLQSPYQTAMPTSSYHNPPISAAMEQVAVSLAGPYAAQTSFAGYPMLGGEYPMVSAPLADPMGLNGNGMTVGVNEMLDSPGLYQPPPVPLFGDDFGSPQHMHHEKDLDWFWPTGLTPSNFIPTGGYGFSTNYENFAPTSVNVMPVSNAAVMTHSSPRQQALSGDARHDLLELIQTFPEMADFLQRCESNYADDAEPLSLDMLQHYIRLYWEHFHKQLPVLHKPTFSVENSNPLLLLAIIAIGTACLPFADDPNLAQNAARLGNILATNVRWRVFNHDDFQPPAKLWVFQTLILLETYEKMYATRPLHERAHIHHATTLTLMRRGSSLTGRAGGFESPHSGRDTTTLVSDAGTAASTDGHGGGGGGGGGEETSMEELWSRWTMQEASRRVAFAAFIVDTLHATMFGHAAILSATELQLELPCDETIWSAPTASECFRIQHSLAQAGVRAPQFRESLAALSHGQHVQTNTFGRTILMVGLLNVAWHDRRIDAQTRYTKKIGLGGGGSGGDGSGSGDTAGRPEEREREREQHRVHLARSADHWLRDFDAYLSSLAPLPSRTDDVHHENVFEARNVLYHLAHISMHSDIVDLQIFAGAVNLLSRPTSRHTAAEKSYHIRHRWAPSAVGRDAAFYALKFLGQVLLPQERTNVLDAPRGAPPTTGVPIYSARDDHLLNRPWVIYYACMVVWSYGFALEGPLKKPCRIPHSTQDKVADMDKLLRAVDAIKHPDDLKTFKGKNQCLGLLLFVKDLFLECRWDLLKESAGRLDKCVRKLVGDE